MTYREVIGKEVEIFLLEDMRLEGVITNNGDELLTFKGRRVASWDPADRKFLIPKTAVILVSIIGSELGSAMSYIVAIVLLDGLGLLYILHARRQAERRRAMMFRYRLLQVGIAAERAQASLGPFIRALRNMSQQLENWRRSHA